MTAEAAMVMPWVLLVIAVAVFLMIFQYNRCLMEQDIGILILRGSTLAAEDRQELEQTLAGQAEGMYSEKYFAWNREKVVIRIEKDILRIRQRGYCISLLSGWKLWGGGRVGEATAVFEGSLLDPAKLVRNYQKLTGGR